MELLTEVAEVPSECVFSEAQRRGDPREEAVVLFHRVNASGTAEPSDQPDLRCKPLELGGARGTEFLPEAGQVFVECVDPDALGYS
jgi:hypothetical protein